MVVQYVNPVYLIKQWMLYRLKAMHFESSVLPKDHLAKMVLILATSCACVTTMDTFVAKALQSGRLQEDMMYVIDKVFHPNGSSDGMNWNEEDTVETPDDGMEMMKHEERNSANLLSKWLATSVNISPNVLTLFLGQSIIMEQSSGPKYRLTTLPVNHHYLCWQELWQKTYNGDDVEVSGIIASMLHLYTGNDLDLSLAQLEYVVFPYSVVERKLDVSSNEATTEAVFAHQKDEKVEDEAYRHVARHVELKDWQSLGRLLLDDEVRKLLCWV